MTIIKQTSAHWILDREAGCRAPSAWLLTWRRLHSVHTWMACDCCELKRASPNRNPSQNPSLQYTHTASEILYYNTSYFTQESQPNTKMVLLGLWIHCTQISSRTNRLIEMHENILQTKSGWTHINECMTTTTHNSPHTEQICRKLLTAYGALDPGRHDSRVFGENVPHQGVPRFGARGVFLTDAAPHALRPLHMTVLMYSQLLLVSATPKRKAKIFTHELVDAHRQYW